VAAAKKYRLKLKNFLVEVKKAKNISGNYSTEEEIK
jgi:hypothetical protein